MSLDQFLDRWKAVPVRTRGIILIAALTLLLVGMAGIEQVKRTSGQEIILTARPVDPRDMLRGAYVSLDYDIERIDPNVLAEPMHFSNKTPNADADAWLVLRKGEYGWDVARVLEQRPAQVGAGEILLHSIWKNRQSWLSAANPEEAGVAPIIGPFIVDIGADRYFADEARDKALEKAVRDGKFEVVLSVGTSGKPVIKGLVLDGVRQDEGFF